ncbi:MAG: sulfatase [Verrucomicrobia bacterium]|nr:sulfatase [Verrucomicrobiota bacterium]
MKITVLILTSILFCGPAAFAAPNVLVVVADQWRAQAFGYTGDPNVKTPNFDKLAKESACFTNAVSGLPVCSPMRATMLTGQRPLTHGVFINDVPLNPEAVTIGKVFKAAGYDTGMIGKWHVDGHGRTIWIPRERRQGFDYWKVLECTHSYNASPYFSDSPEKQVWKDYDAKAQTDDLCAYLRERKPGGRPFIMFLAWGPPHNPYETAPAKYKALYDPAKLTLRGNVPANMEGETRKNLAGYYAHCSALDDCMGEIMKTLGDTGLRDDTIVIFTADHGDMLGSQGMQRKQRPFDESVRVPMLMSWPKGGLKTEKLKAPINAEDIMPTLLGLSGVAIPKSVEGLDYSAYLRGGANPGDDTTVIQCPNPFGEWTRQQGGREYRGVRTVRYTFVRDLNGPWLLFDNETDPLQMNNLVNKPEQAKLQGDLDALLMKKLKERGDEFKPGPYYIAKWNYKVDASGTAPYKN